MKQDNIKDWKVTDERFVAYLDIMGFKDLVARSSHEIVLNKLRHLSSHVNYLAMPEWSRGKIHTTWFSDSIIVFSKDDSSEAADAFIYAVRYLMCRALESGLCIKGGMAFGKLTVDLDKQLYFGQPLIDAYLLEEDLQYYGVIVHHTAERKILPLPNQYARLNFFNMPTKLRQGVVNHMNVNWFDLARNVERHGYNLRHLLNEIKLTVSGAPRRYLDNTLEALAREEENYKEIVEETKKAEQIMRQIGAKPLPVIPPADNTSATGIK